MALAAKEVGSGRAVEALADPAKLLFFVLSGLHGRLFSEMSVFRPSGRLKFGY